MKKTKTEKLVISAVLISLGTAISFICQTLPFFALPIGGTITIASTLPLILIGYMFGLKWGIGSAFVYSVLQIATSYKTVAGLFTPSSESYMGIMIAFAVVLLDYMLAYTSIGLSALFRNLKSKTGALVYGSVFGLLFRYVFHVLSGAIFYGAWAEWFFTDTLFANFAVSQKIIESFHGTGLAFVYSAVYNGCYMLPEIIITAVCAAAISKFKFSDKAE